MEYCNEEILQLLPVMPTANLIYNFVVIFLDNAMI